MKILFIGDIVGRIGCEHLRRILPDFKRRHNVGLVIANGENSADRNGITPETAEHIFTSGVNVITTGNHAFRQSSCNYYYEECPYIIRPANFPEPSYGKGFCIVDMISAQVCVINLLGNVFMNQYGSPFELVDKLIDENSGCPIKIIDFHAEATAEKKAFAYYCDGRVSAVLGTHTHVPTADAQILPNKTGEKIIHNQHVIVFAEKAFGNDNIIGCPMRKGLHRHRIYIAGNIFCFCFFWQKQEGKQTPAPRAHR